MSQLRHFKAVLHVGHVDSLIGKTRHVFRTHNDNNNHLISSVVARVYMCSYVAALWARRPAGSSPTRKRNFSAHPVPLLLLLEELKFPLWFYPCWCETDSRLNDRNSNYDGRCIVMVLFALRPADNAAGSFVVFSGLGYSGRAGLKNSTVG